MPIQSEQTRKRPRQSCTALRDAATRGDIDVLRTLLDAGDTDTSGRCYVDAADSFGMTALMWAAHGGHTDCVQLLLQHSADVRKRSLSGSEATHYAAQRGHKEVRAAVLDAGCDVNAADVQQMTPLLYAAREGHTDCVRLLLQHGADAHRLTDDGSTAAHYAAQRGNKEVLVAVLDAGCGVDVKDKLNRTPLTMALNYAIACGNADCARVLLQRGADASNCRSTEYAHIFARGGDKETLLALLDAGCGADTAGYEGMTPLMWAAEEGRTDCVQLLLEHGADAIKSDYGGLTAVHHTAVHNDVETLRVLLASAAGPVTLDPMFLANLFAFVSDTYFSCAIACGCSCD